MTPSNTTCPKAIQRGDTLTFPFQVTVDPILGTLGTCIPNKLPPDLVPQALTGWQLWFTLKLYYSDPDSQAVAQLDNMTLGGVTVTSAHQGLAKAVVPNTVTQTFPDGPVTLYYDIQAKDPAGNVTTLESGTTTVGPDVTRRTT
jgi:hypothetical protein